MPLTWNEIKIRARDFSREWADDFNEDAEAKSFLDGFFQVFGIPRRRFATFETKVHTGTDKTGYIDLLWKANILVEMKSRGKNLDRAYKQATGYFAGLKDEELPKFVLVCDFRHFRLYDLEEDTEEEFELKDLHKNVKLFGFMIGYLKQTYKPEDPVNIKAAELMGDLHDELKAVGYTGHQLELYLVRLLFCLFADDTSIFEHDIFHDYIQRKTKEDGSDIGIHIAQLFQVLNTPEEQRMSSLDEDLALFPYVNGKLFEETLAFASWNSGMRKLLLRICTLNWGAISPAIFGSMFQSVMDKNARRNLGAHYTSEKNILKLIKPLFLDNLHAEFQKVKKNKEKLEAFHKKLASLKFLDPACGCGNFLVVSYRELRLLEIEVIRHRLLLQGIQVGSDVSGYAQINLSQVMQCEVDQFYGIEYEEFPAQIAQVAMWLVDHQMNMQASDEFLHYYRRLPLKKSATIIHGNALRLNWHTFQTEEAHTTKLHASQVEVTQVVNEEEAAYKLEIHAPQVTYRPARTVRKEDAAPYNFILGNPPFVGKSLMNEAQKQDTDLVFKGIKGAGVLDYVTCWYVKAAQYMQRYGTEQAPVKTAFVSTNSISQGEQVGILWGELFNKYHIKIHFAHRTFSWTNEARGKAAVHVVIIGFANFDTPDKSIFEYEDIKGEPHEMKVKNINPYLVEGKDLVISKRREPIAKVPPISFGSMPNDGGNFLFTNEEKMEFVKAEPRSDKFFKPILSAYEFLNGEQRWCLWLEDAVPKEIKATSKITERVKAVKEIREKSNRESTRKLASFPTLFGEIRQPKRNYILVPRHSSENRKYLPLGFFTPNVIVSDSCLAIDNSNLYHFGILTSLMHPGLSGSAAE